MKAIFITILFILFTLQLNAQVGRGLEYKGVVVLTDNTLIQGYLRYHSSPQISIVEIESDGKLLIFDAFRISYFKFYDHYFSIIRTVYSLPYNKSSQNKENITFFEALYEGPHLSLLNKVYYYDQLTANRWSGGKYWGRDAHFEDWRNADWVNSGYRYGRPWYTIRALEWAENTFLMGIPHEELYLLRPDGALKKVNPPSKLTIQEDVIKKVDKELIMQMVADKQPQVNKYIKANNIDIRRRSGLFALVHYYNELKEKDKPKKPKQ